MPPTETQTLSAELPSEETSYQPMIKANGIQLRKGSDLPPHSSPSPLHENSALAQQGPRCKERQQKKDEGFRLKRDINLKEALLMERSILVQRLHLCS